MYLREPVYQRHDRRGAHREGHAPGYGKIDIIDSCSLSMGEGLIVLTACEMAKKGCGHDEIVKRALLHAENGEGLVFLDTVEYLHKGGRLHLEGPDRGKTEDTPGFEDRSRKGKLVMAGRALG